ncbi:MAG: cytochrome ubiquinol oxidase subunit I [Ignavibacteria bacterium]|nr:cytochrome ubiquinol oxidase subunit I [Ignavibacteria bacterium]
MGEVELLSRIQFAITAGFHFLYPPMSIGLGIALVIMEGMYLKTKDKKWEDLTRFWVKIFGIIFAMGVASGIVMEFQFGTNWAPYSRFVGDVFGSVLAAEGIFAFFLESGFLALLLFGWNRVKPPIHFLSTIIVTFGAHFSAVWILVANSWMQTPAGFQLVTKQVGETLVTRAEITDFWQVVFNPSTIDRLTHTIFASWLTGAALILSISAYYILKNRHLEEAKSAIKVGLIILIITSILQLITGHQSAVGVAKHQPSKLAAMEGHFEASAPAPLHIFGWVDTEEQKVKYGIAIPGMLSWLVHFDSSKPITGLNHFKPEDRPPVNIVFQSFRIMVGIGLFFILLSIVGTVLWASNKLTSAKWFLWILVFSVILPHLANQTGWIVAEVGRQPWIVYGIMRTSEAFSQNLSPGEAWFSLILFTAIYILIFILFLFLLDRTIRRGIGIYTKEDIYSKQKSLLEKG